MTGNLWAALVDLCLIPKSSNSLKVAERFKEKNYHAILMSGYIRGLLIEEFPNEVKEGANDRIMFCKAGKFCLYFKKLDDSKKPHNVKTEYSKLVAHQRTIPGGEKMPIIFIGYTVDETWAELKGIYAVYIEGRKRVWVTVIDENTVTGFGDGIEQTPVSPNPIAPKDIRIRRKAV